MRPGRAAPLAVFAARAALALLWLAPASAGRANDAWFESGRAQISGARAALEARGAPPARARNLILFLGDGMGVSTTTAARILEGQQRGLSGEEHELSFERFPQLGLLKVYNTNQQVPDSAGTMTAIMSGVKTAAGVLGVDARVVFDDHASVAASRVTTLFERAETRGLRTGLVSSAELTHATPAACYAHAPNRAWTHDAALPPAARAAGFPDIARQLLEFAHGDGVDVMLGGGRAHFLRAEQRDPEAPAARGLRRDGLDLPARWQSKARDRAVVWNARELHAQDPHRTRQLLGLFAPGHLAFHVDQKSTRPGEPTLSQMTEAALRFLAHSERGFVLMVEGGRIDHAHHLGNAHRALHETIEFAAAVTRALELTDASQTLIVVTADHSHPLTLAGYTARGNPVLGWVNAPPAGGENPPALAQDGLGRPYTALQYAAGPGHHAPSDAQGAGPKTFPHLPKSWSAHTENPAPADHTSARNENHASPKPASTRAESPAPADRTSARSENHALSKPTSTHTENPAPADRTSARRENHALSEPASTHTENPAPADRMNARSENHASPKPASTRAENLAPADRTSARGAEPASKGRPANAATETARARADPNARDFLQRAGVPLAVGVHSGEDVLVYATGPGAELFNGVREQHTLYHAMVEALGWNDARAP